VQDALLSAYAALTAGREVHRLGPWLRTVARNAAISKLRARRARPTPRAGECPCDARIDETSHQREQLRVLLTALGELPDRQREALVMREFEGRSYVHIGARLGLGEGAVAQLLNRARRTLRRKLSALNGVAPVLRWTSSGGGGAIATPAGGAAGCVATAKVCAAVLLPALTTSLAAGVTSPPAVHQHGANRLHVQLTRKVAAARVPTATAAPAPRGGTMLRPSRSPRGSTTAVSRTPARRHRDRERLRRAIGGTRTDLWAPNGAGRAGHSSGCRQPPRRR